MGDADEGTIIIYIPQLCSLLMILFQLQHIKHDTFITQLTQLLRAARFVLLCCLICSCILANISCIFLNSSSFSASILSF